jgi:predicted AAA+ superfamily ATPase
MHIQRDLLQKIAPFLSRREYIAVVGPRQSGKTTFLEIPDKRFLGFGKKR